MCKTFIEAEIAPVGVFFYFKKKYIWNIYLPGNVFRQDTAGRKKNFCQEKSVEEKRKGNVQEVKEAMAAGVCAVHCLEEAKKKLEDAKYLGIWDILGGGALSSMLKHNRLEEAQESLELAGKKVKMFEKELADISVNAEIHVEIQSFEKFADIFFDNILSDWAMQEKITRASKQVDEALERIRQLLLSLQMMNQRYQKDGEEDVVWDVLEM